MKYKKRKEIKQYMIIHSSNTLKCYNLFFFISSPYYDWFITKHECKSFAQSQNWTATVHRVIVLFNLLHFCGY